MWFQKISIPTLRRAIGNSMGEGFPKANFYFKGKYEPKLEFLERKGSLNQRPSMGGEWMFSRTTHS